MKRQIDEPMKGRRKRVLTTKLYSEIVAFSNWNFPHTPDPNGPDPETSIRNEVQPPGSNDNLIVEFLIKFLRARQKWLNPEKHYCKQHSSLPPPLLISEILTSTRYEDSRRSSRIPTKRHRFYAPRTNFGKD